jgi:chemosensory pili system protein ChpC
VKPSAGQQPIHSLEIPLNGVSLLLPSAAVAEVANPAPLSPLPMGPVWSIGILGWRAQAVPIISFEALLGHPVAAVGPTSRIVVMYPLRGGRAGGFFGFYAIAEPRPQPIIEGAVEPLDAASLPDTPLIGAGVKLKDKTLLIPDLDVLQRAFYP